MSEPEPVRVVQAPSPYSSAQQMLLDFVRDHDAPCPICGYNVRGLTRPVCPECRHDLVLTVGVPRPRIAWLLAAIAPGSFSGIAAFFLLIPIVGSLVMEGGPLPPTVLVVDLFGWSSGLFAVFIGVRRMRFIAQPRARQMKWACTIWAIHVTALALLIFVGPRYMR
jgi:hypothetical protein